MDFTTQHLHIKKKSFGIEPHELPIHPSGLEVVIPKYQDEDLSCVLGGPPKYNETKEHLEH